MFKPNKLSQKKFFVKGGVFGFALGAFLVLGIFVYTLYSLAAWTSPTAAPPGNNIAEPINGGLSAQAKLGTFKLGTTTAPVSSANLFVYNGGVSIATTTVNPSMLIVNNFTGTAINAAGGYITGVHDPSSASDVVNKGWADSRYALVSASGFWVDRGSNKISNANTGNVGIGANDPSQLFSVGASNQFTVNTTGDVVANTYRGNFLGTWDGYATNTLPYLTSSLASGYILAGNSANIAAATSTIFLKNNNVGIGILNPGHLLDVTRSSSAGNAMVGLTTSGGDGSLYIDNANNYSIYTNRGNVVLGFTSGNVGIGTSSSATYRLDVKDSIRLSGDIKVGGQVIIGAGDLAEEFYTDQDYPAGTVLVMDNSGYKTARACSEEYDAAVIGVISEKPGLVIGRVVGEHKAPVALTGVVKVRINNTGGQIQQGSLLTTSAVTGEAMRAASPQLGTIIGKSLEDDTGKGWVMALVNLK